MTHQAVDRLVSHSKEFKYNSDTDNVLETLLCASSCDESEGSAVAWCGVTRLAAVHALALSFDYEPECDAWRALHYILFSHKIIARLRVFQVLNHDNNHRNTGSVFTNDLTTRSTRFCRYLYFPGTDWKPAYKILPKRHGDLSRAMNYRPLNKYHET